jgi:hypothetical protein
MGWQVSLGCSVVRLTLSLSRGQEARTGDAVERWWFSSLLVKLITGCWSRASKKLGELVGGFVAAPNTEGLGLEHLQIPEIPSGKARAASDVMQSFAERN